VSLRISTGGVFVSASGLIFADGVLCPPAKAQPRSRIANLISASLFPLGNKGIRHRVGPALRQSRAPPPDEIILAMCTGKKKIGELSVTVMRWISIGLLALRSVTLIYVLQQDAKIMLGIQVGNVIYSAEFPRRALRKET
jgi:hypothetical protein